MKKKVIGTSILLLILLLNLSGISYASYKEDYTLPEFKNMIYNYIKGELGTEDQTLINLIDNSQDIEDLYNSATDTYYIIGTAQWTNNAVFYTWNDQNSMLRYVSDYIGPWNRSGSTRQYTRIFVNQGNLIVSNSNISNNSWTSVKYTSNKYQTTNANVYTYNNNTQTLKYSAYSLPSGVENGPFQEEVQTQLYFYPEATSQNANVYVFEDVPLYTKSNNQNLLIGMLAVPNETTITDVLVERFYYNGQDYVTKVLSQNINNNYITYELYETDNKQKAYNIYFNRNSLYDNNIYLIEWKDKTVEPYEWTQAVFYIKNNKTAIINGEINPVVTFSGDTNIGNNNIIDNQNDNNDFWKNIYNEMFTLDSGEATQMLDNFITNTNLGEIGTLSGEIMALNLLNGEPSDFVISWNNVIIPNLKDNDPKLLIPAGNINFSKLSVTLGNETYQSPKAQDIVDVIGYVRIILGYTIVVLLIANIWETLMHVLGVGTAIYEDNADEKAELYNVDLDTGTVNYTKIHKIPSKKQSWFYHRKG